VTGESVVWVTGAKLEDGFLEELGARAKAVKTAASNQATIAVLGVETTKDLARVAAVREKLADGAALWLVYPKGRKDPREVDVIGAGRAAGMKDVKVAKFSETHTALKFVR
jgi:hypothetical protein